MQRFKVKFWLVLITVVAAVGQFYAQVKVQNKIAMKKSKFAEAQIVFALKQSESGICHLSVLYELLK
jgi:hypothetical protein